MRLGFLTLPTDERRLYIDQAAIRRNVSPVVLEKDFWVCWLLGLLFGSEFAGSLVFKGGTSLSKVFGVIERFSEDIDLSLSPEFLKLPEAGTSRTQANKENRDALRIPCVRNGFGRKLPFVSSPVRTRGRRGRCSWPAKGLKGELKGDEKADASSPGFPRSATASMARTGDARPPSNGKRIERFLKRAPW
jgi:hypothetical protein